MARLGIHARREGTSDLLQPSLTSNQRDDRIDVIAITQRLINALTPPTPRRYRAQIRCYQSENPTVAIGGSDPSLRQVARFLLVAPALLLSNRHVLLRIIGLLPYHRHLGCRLGVCTMIAGPRRLR